MAITEAQARAKRKWDSKNLDRIQLVVRAGEREQIRAAAEAVGESLNHYIVSATKYRMEREGRPLYIVEQKEEEAPAPEGK